MEKTGFIFINLLPYRAKIKAIQIKEFSGLLFAFALFSGILVFLGHLWLSVEIEQQEERNTFIEKENKKLDQDISSISGLKEEIKLTLEKRKVVESLQLNRADGVNIINELANNLPDGASLKNIKRVGDILTITGQTSSNNKVSNYMTALESSQIFESPTLVEVKSVILIPNKPQSNTNKKTIATEEIKVSEFTITVLMQKSEEELKMLSEEKDKMKKPQVKEEK